ncbi:UV radiation resistance-associated protein [Geodia barretti]|uniref:UV radiation resistance-associated protein n=1 Tax=Geodia barretti TaxID=519541 RepID=A0AA35QW53_GEOBA|nr:UV radiation resistance-associated protein [Geodia barretti]
MVVSVLPPRPSKLLLSLSPEPTRVEQLGVALGYVAHLVHHLGKILFIPLLYPIRPQGSKSVILDLVSEETLIDNIKEFPLFAKGSEKALFQYAVFLLNKDIAQVRQHCGYGTSKTLFKRTLPNLKFLLDRLTRDIKAMMRGINHAAGFHTPHPHDAISMTSSYVGVDANSVASGSVAPDSFPSSDADSLRSFSTLGSHAGSMPPSMFTQTQQFLQHDSNFSLRSIASSTRPDEESRHNRSIHSDIDDLLIISPPDLSKSGTEGDETDKACNEHVTAPLTDSATELAFSRGPRRVDGEISEECFSTIREDIQPSGDDDEEEEEEEEEEGGDSTTSSVVSLSTTPVVHERFVKVDSTPESASSSSFAALSGDESMGETLSNDSSAAVELGSSTVSAHLEDTLKSAVHVTQLLLGHNTPPEHIQIESVPTILAANEAEMESARALRGLTAASFAGQTALGVPHLNLPEETANNGQEEKEEDFATPQGPPTFPDSFQMSSRTGEKTCGELSSGNGEGFSTSPEWPRVRSMAQSGFALENIGYVKTGMATPHRVGGGGGGGGGGLRHSREERLERFIGGGSPDNRNGENGQSLVDFIDRPSDTGNNSTQNRFRQRLPDLLGPRGAF